MMTTEAETTGRQIVFYHHGAFEDAARHARQRAGIEMPVGIQGAEDDADDAEPTSSRSVVVRSLGVAICAADDDQIKRLETGARSPIRSVRQEYIFRIATPDTRDASYLRGYRAGVDAVIRDLLASGISGPAGVFGVQDDPAFTDNADLTWGLQAIGLPSSARTGAGVRVAILDTGFDAKHPDFANRVTASKSFVTGAPTAQDDNGHGTHCLGTLAGPRKPSQGPRYGVAPDAQVFVGKVMDASGHGREGDILRGIGWALANQCRLVSMSFGKAVGPGVAPDDDYEEIGKVALAKNCLLIVAAGNDSSRPQDVVPVEMPANSNTFMAVGALSRHLGMYPKSNGGINHDGGGVDLVGPGVDVRSSKRLPVTYGFDTGTSMATPHVSGAAALFIEADPAATAEQIWTRLTQTANRLPLSSTDVGAGLVQVG